MDKTFKLALAISYGASAPIVASVWWSFFANWDDEYAPGFGLTYFVTVIIAVVAFGAAKLIELIIHEHR